MGYAKADKAGIYNILIMEEKQTILAAGAGTTTKIVLPEKIRLDNGKETNLIRLENVKDVASYIRTIDEIIEHKQRQNSAYRCAGSKSGCRRRKSVNVFITPPIPFASRIGFFMIFIRERKDGCIWSAEESGLSILEE